MQELEISVIIPTYNSEKTIERLLTGLTVNSSYRPSQIIISDGYSDDNTIGICQKFEVDIILNRQRHAAAGRNLGILQSKYEIIAFIDSDCIPNEDWLESIFFTFQQGNSIVGCGGRMFAHKAANFIEEFSGNVFLKDLMKFEDFEKEVNKVELANAFITANCSYKKDFLNSLGNFNEFFSNNGEDIDLFWRAIKSKDGKLIYNPKIIVFHSFPSNYKALYKKYFQYGLASSKLMFKHSKSRFNIDTKLYKNLLYRLIKLPFNFRNNSLYLIQLTSHIMGKLYGSIRYRIINL